MRCIPSVVVILLAGLATTPAIAQAPPAPVVHSAAISGGGRQLGRASHYDGSVLVLDSLGRTILRAKRVLKISIPSIPGSSQVATIHIRGKLIGTDSLADGQIVVTFDTDAPVPRPGSLVPAVSEGDPITIKVGGLVQASGVFRRVR
jgi:hypothetical protein